MDIRFQWIDPLNCGFFYGLPDRIDEIGKGDPVHRILFLEEFIDLFLAHAVLFEHHSQSSQSLFVLVGQIISGTGDLG
ncbi:MAG: hypothetical protein IKQ98_01345 [Erysipelotrichaceae bacterium]|nr:hypothetical protein [Erysipelotrichaceae bacterium]